jgi:Tfp pilus assembly protein PilF
MTEAVASIRQAAELFGVPEARLRYWAQTGFVGPSARQGGRAYYSFQDLVSLKVAISLLDGGLSMQRVRKNLDALRARLPEVASPLASMRVCSDGDELVVVDDGAAYQPATGQLVMSFAVRQLAERLADVRPLRGGATGSVAGPAPERETAHGCFAAGVAALDAGDDPTAETMFRNALALDPRLAAAWTNLGNVLDRRGSRGAAREAYQKALALDPDQPEARFNLANLHAELGETELALAEYRRVARATSSFADVHFNLGMTLVSVGAVAQARAHLARYLELDDASSWADRARELLGQLG